MFCSHMVKDSLDDFFSVHGKESNYDSSYAFLVVYNENTQRYQRFCVNYQQWRTSSIAPTLSEAENLHLGWWGNIINNTNVCIKNQSATYESRVVALNYRMDNNGACTLRSFNPSRRLDDAIQYEVGELVKANASAGLLLVEKGRNYVRRWLDYLQKFGDGVSGGNVSFRFYRPKSSSWDLSMFIIWLLAVFCVGVGGYWAGHRKSCEEKMGLDSHFSRTVVLNSSQKKNLEHEDEKMTTPANCLFVVIAMVIVVGILMLGFYFRYIMVYIFNVILPIVGTFSMHRCLSSAYSFFCKCGHCRICVSMNDVTRSLFKRELFKNEYCSRRPRVASVVIFVFSATFCTSWFFFRRSPYAFILLDFINVTLCLHVLKWIRFPNLKWLTVLLLCMFVYDMFMVFGTPYFTKNGCSVMIEVAAGTDCEKSSTGYPVAPISGDIPEKFPMLFQVPRLSDPMLSCIDLQVEKEYRPVILGLGDVIVPGYLISFCFTVDFSAKTRYLYGLVSVVGYGLGLVATFCALTVMESAQPALIYLIPFTLIPIILLSVIRGEFKLLWHGRFSKNEVCFLPLKRILY
ncbi:unnamed protein product [Enterobius vermicularis]|uniref:Signal peptide peptidase-like 2B n=1 Tax=Enterobius vermicularis TaxID=51028 RepID=A0A0N4UYB4_ENTVE|nr:unnamed protein product [Enterobius vermicularis]